MPKFKKKKFLICMSVLSDSNLMFDGNQRVFE